MDHDVIVVGGGAAGLAAMAGLEDQDALLLERADRLGGRLHSLPRGAAWINLGAHLLTGGQSQIKRLVDDLGLEVLPIPGAKTALWFRGRLFRYRRAEAYPFSLPLSMSERIALIRVGVRLRVMVEIWRRRSRRRPGEDAVAFHRRLSELQSGRTFADLLVGVPKPVAEIFETAARRSAAEAGELTLGAALGLFAALWVSGDSASVVNIDGGSGRYGQAWRERLGQRAVLGAEVFEIAESGDGVGVRYRSGGVETTVSARHLIVAVPAPEVANLVEVPGTVRHELSTLHYGAFVCMGVLTGESGPVPWDDVYAITAPGLSFSMLFNHTNPMGVAARGAGKSLMCYAGGAPAQSLLNASDDEIRAAFLADLERVLPGVGRTITETVVQRWPAGNFYRGPDTRLGELLRWNSRPEGRVRLAGDYFGPLGGTLEAATVSGLAAAGEAIAAMGPLSIKALDK
jgi:protoporphyrinogen oxidase